MSYFKSLFEAVNINTEDIEAQKVTHKVEKPNGKYQVFKSVSFQCDTIYMPPDQGKIYILTVVDLKTSQCDAEPMINRNADTLKKAFTNIFNRNKINSANVKVINSDLGTEFNNNSIKHFFDDLGIIMKFSKTNRHTQQAKIERLNFILKKVLWGRMSVVEQQTGKKNTEWVRYLPLVINKINKNLPKEKPIKYYFQDPKIKKDEVILEEGDEVYIMKDFPTDNIEGKRLYGDIRAGEQKYSTRKYKISRVLIYPNQPVRYMVDGLDSVSYSRGQLLLA